MKREDGPEKLVQMTNTENGSTKPQDIKVTLLANTNQTQDSEENIVKEQQAVVSIQKPATTQEDQRGKWGNKLQFICATVGFAVGLGNVWRFPYLCQKNGGGAFLIPYFISLFFLGIPLFFLELGIGQSVRQGSIGVWNYIHPYLGGVGYACVVVCLLVGMYYNMIIAWCFYYLFASWQSPLPYASCPKITTHDNGSTIYDPQCELAGRTQYYWYNNALKSSASLEESGGITWHLALSLLLAWIVVWLCMMKGVQSAGKAVYFTATFPYIVLIIFFGRGISLPGAMEGIGHMFKPEFEKLIDPQVWLQAATQIFFSLSLAFGGLIAMSSYNPVHNNCHRDAILVSCVNCGTSVFASIVIFSILGFKAHRSLTECQLIHAPNGSVPLVNKTIEEECKDINYWLSKTASGPGLTFIAFTEAIVKMPISPLWATLFFCMLLTLGLGSMFGTLEGVITPVYDLKLVSWRKEFVTAAICAFCYVIGLLFCQRSGEYWLQMFDNFSATIPLLIIGFFELVGVSWIYGLKRFEDDIEYMIKMRPSIYFRYTWKFISPALVLVILIASLISMGLKPMQYSGFDLTTGKPLKLNFPGWAYVIIAFLIGSSFLFIPGMLLLRYFGILKYERKQYGKARVGEDVAPAAITPSMSQIPLPRSEMPLAGRAGNGQA